MKLVIVIVNYNTPADTIDCLESLKKNRLPDGLTVQTILVDNSSIDDSVEILSQKYPEIELIINPKNLGFTGGNNVGIQAALQHSPTHILLLNPDTVVPLDFFDKIFTCAINQAQVGLVTPLIYFAKGFEFHNRYTSNQLGRVVWSAGGKLDWANILGSNNHVDEVDEGQFTQVEDTDFATGACLLIRREVIDQIGFLNQNYFLYLEDLEFSQRARTKGWRVVFDPSIKLWHKVSQSSGVGSDLNDYFITRNRLLFGLKYATLRAKFALIREAVRFIISGNLAKQLAVKDYIFCHLGKGTYLK